MSLSRSIFRNFLAQALGRLYTSFLSFVVTMVLLARVLSPEDFGVYNFYLTLFYICVTVIDFGSNTIAIREASRDEARLPGLLHALLRMRGTLSLLCLFSVWALAMALEREGDLRLLICLAALHLPFCSLGGYNAVFHVKMRFDYAAWISGLGQSLFLALAALFFFLGSKNPAHYLMAYGAGMAGTNLANLYFSRRFLPDTPEAKHLEAGPLFREALPLGIAAVMASLYFYLDTVLLRLMKGEAEVGYYNAAYRLLAFSLMIPVLFNQVCFPVFSRLLAGGGEKGPRLEPIFRRAVLYMGAAGLPAAAALCIFSRPLLTLVCGTEYARSSHCLSILGLALAAIFLAYPLLSVLVASGRQVLVAWIAAGSGILNLLLNLLLIPRFGMEGAAWATVVTEGVVLCCAGIAVQRSTGLNPLHPELYKVLLAAAGVAGFGVLFKDGHPAVALSLLALFYVGLLFALRLLPFDLHDEDRD